MGEHQTLERLPRGQTWPLPGTSVLVQHRICLIGIVPVRPFGISRSTLERMSALGWDACQSYNRPTGPFGRAREIAALAILGIDAVCQGPPIIPWAPLPQPQIDQELRRRADGQAKDQHLHPVIAGPDIDSHPSRLPVWPLARSATTRS